MQFILRGDQPGDPATPTVRQHRRAIPPAPASIRESDPRHIASRKVHGVFRMSRDRQFVIPPLECPVKILHAKGLREVLVWGLENFLPADLLECRPCGIEVPVLVLEIRPRGLRSPPGHEVRQFPVRRGEVDSGPGGQQVVQGGGRFDRQKRGDVLESQIDHGPVEQGGFVETYFP